MASKRVQLVNAHLTGNSGAMAYNKVPASASLKPQPFTAHISDEELNDFKQAVKYSKIGPKTYENLKDDRSFGVSREWLTNAKQHWLTNYDWRKTEARINTLPNFTVSIEYQGDNYDVHFAALFSEKPGAVPLTFLHGWPGIPNWHLWGYLITCARFVSRVPRRSRNP